MMEISIVKPASHTRGRFFLTRGDAARLAVGAIGFFIGRIALFDDMVNPVAIGFLSSLTGTGFSFYTTALFVLLGIATKLQYIYLIRYIVCVGLLCAINIFARQYLVLKKNLYITVFAQGIAGSICIIVGGLSVAWLGGDGISLYLLILSLVEAVLAFFLAFVLCKASTVLTAPKRKLWLSNEEVKHYMGVSLRGEITV
jgi:uncharacterized membrane protein YfcA